jgi:hypothetical protein
MAEAAGQRRWRAWVGARRSDGDVVSFGHGRWRGRDGAHEKRRGGVGGIFRHGRSGRLLTRLAHLYIAVHNSQSGRGARRHYH